MIYDAKLGGGDGVQMWERIQGVEVKENRQDTFIFCQSLSDHMGKEGIWLALE